MAHSAGQIMSREFTSGHWVLRDCTGKLEDLAEEASLDGKESEAHVL